MAAAWDVIVVGAGVEGSATAYYLAKRGKRTLLLEQFPLPHTRGSSHGQSRIIRKAYTEGHYADMMGDAYTMWSQLERETGSTLYTKTGMLVIGKAGGSSLSDTENALRRIGADYVTLSPSELKRRYVMMTFDDSFSGLVDHDAGILHADKCLAQLQNVFLRNGGTLNDGEKVVGIHPGKVVTITTNKQVYKTNSLVLAAGPWMPKLLKPLGLNLPLQPLRITVCYWKQRGDVTVHGRGNMPIFICYDTVGRDGKPVDVYGLPANEYPEHVKLCTHSGPPIDPDSRDLDRAIDWEVKQTQDFVQEHFPLLEDVPSILERCIYTMTPNEDFVLDAHPHWKNIVVGAGFSGHGFKMAPVVGKILGELALGNQASYDMKPFSISRFFSKSQL